MGKQDNLDGKPTLLCVYQPKERSSSSRNQQASSSSSLRSSTSSLSSTSNNNNNGGEKINDNSVRTVETEASMSSSTLFDNDDTVSVCSSFSSSTHTTSSSHNSGRVIPSGRRRSMREVGPKILERRRSIRNLKKDGNDEKENKKNIDPEPASFRTLMIQTGGVKKDTNKNNNNNKTTVSSSSSSSSSNKENGTKNGTPRSPRKPAVPRPRRQSSFRRTPSKRSMDAGNRTPQAKPRSQSDCSGLNSPATAGKSSRRLQELRANMAQQEGHLREMMTTTTTSSPSTEKRADRGTIDVRPPLVYDLSSCSTETATSTITSSSSNEDQDPTATGAGKSRRHSDGGGGILASPKLNEMRTSVNQQRRTLSDLLDRSTKSPIQTVAGGVEPIVYNDLKGELLSAYELIGQQTEQIKRLEANNKKLLRQMEEAAERAAAEKTAASTLPVAVLAAHLKRNESMETTASTRSSSSSFSSKDQQNQQADYSEASLRKIESLEETVKSQEEEIIDLKAKLSQLEIDRAWGELQLRNRITNDAHDYEKTIGNWRKEAAQWKNRFDELWTTVKKNNNNSNNNNTGTTVTPPTAQPQQQQVPPQQPSQQQSNESAEANGDVQARLLMEVMNKGNPKHVEKSSSVDTPKTTYATGVDQANLLKNVMKNNNTNNNANSNNNGRRMSWKLGGIVGKKLLPMELESADSILLERLKVENEMLRRELFNRQQNQQQQQQQS